MIPDNDVCARAVQAKDARFDGVFFTGVLSTGIYCRPSCPAITPNRRNMRFFAAAAGAQAAGFRACKRCRPDAVPGSPEWDVRADLVGRAMRLIADGEVDRHGVPGLATTLGYSRRAVERALVTELGAGPLALARAQRAHTARRLIETTDLPLTDVAFAAGFKSVRQFNDTLQQVFASTPGQLRSAARARNRSGSRRDGRGRGDGPVAASGTVRLRLSFREPLLPDSLFGHLVATAVPGVEEWRDGAYRRTVRLPHGAGIITLRPSRGYVDTTLVLGDLKDLAAAVARCRRLLDLDADPVAVDAALAEDPDLAVLVASAPGRRIPRTVDEPELALRAVLGQQVSTAAARTHAGRLVQALGEPVHDPAGGLTHLFPTPAQIAGCDPQILALPEARRRTLLALAAAIAEGRVDLGPGADRDAAREMLGALPGIGAWTVETIAMRALGDPDAFPVTDLGVRSGARALGFPTGAAALALRSRPWRPWRAYATQHLWSLGDHPINHLPDDGHQPRRHP